MGRKKKNIDITFTGDSSNINVSLPSSGLGDTIKKITSAIGIQTCGKCEERRKKLNKLFPWLNSKDMDKLKGDELELMKRVINKPSEVSNDDVNSLFTLYNKIYSPSRPVKRCQCPGLLRQIVERLTLLIEED